MVKFILKVHFILRKRAISSTFGQVLWFTLGSSAKMLRISDCSFEMAYVPIGQNSAQSGGFGGYLGEAQNTPPTAQSRAKSPPRGVSSPLRAGGVPFQSPSGAGSRGSGGPNRESTPRGTPCPPRFVPPRGLREPGQGGSAECPPKRVSRPIFKGQNAIDCNSPLSVKML